MRYREASVVLGEFVLRCWLAIIRPILRGKTVQIAGCRFLFLSAKKDYAWVEQQQRALRDALTILQQPSVLEYGALVSAAIRGVVYVHGYHAHEVMLHRTVLFEYELGRTDNPMFAASQLVYYAAKMKQEDQGIGNARQKQFAFLSSIPEGLAVLNWLRAWLVQTYPAEAAALPGNVGHVSQRD